jgi:outer membrane protein TolC
MNLRGILLLFPFLWVGCRVPYDTALIERRTATLYGSDRPWYEDETADTVLSPRAELAAYLRFGLLHNARLRAAFHRWRAALDTIPQVSALPDPVFTYAHFVEDIETRTGPQRQRFSLQQTFPWFGVLQLRGEVAAREAESLWWKVVAARLSVVREIKQAYFEYAYLAQAIRIDEDNLRLLRQLEPVVQRRVQAGANQEDLLRLQVEIGRLENDLESRRKFRPALSARLSAAMNARAREPLPLPDEVVPLIAELEVGDLDLRLQRDNPELAVLREEIARAQKRAELAGLSGWPDVTQGAD